MVVYGCSGSMSMVGLLSCWKTYRVSLFDFSSSAVHG